MANRNAWNRGSGGYGNPYSMSGLAHVPSLDRRSGYGAPVYGGAYRDDRRAEPVFRGPAKPADRPPVNRKRSRSPAKPHSDQKNQNRHSSDRPVFHSRYEVVVPNQVFQDKETAVPDLKRRFHKMYVPSDFFHADYRWQESFLASQPFRLGNACDFHIFNKDVDNPNEPSDLVYSEPSDVNYTYSSKVMLLSSSDLATLYQNFIRVAEEDVSASAKKISWLKQLNFLVGTRGKEVMAIGGPWSPSLDGENPAEDPQVLINTAVRTCKAQTGIDLSPCTRWYKFLELHYYRPAERLQASRKPAQEGETKVEDVETTVESEEMSEPRVETVVMFLPDIYNCMPSAEAWQNLCNVYKEHLASKLEPPAAPEQPATNGEVTPANTSVGENGATEQANEEDENTTEQAKTENAPTTPTKLDPANMKVAELRAELDARGIDSKGLKSQLIAKLESALKEEEKKEKKDKDLEAAIAKQEDDVPKEEPPQTEQVSPKEPTVLTEKDKRRLERLYRLDESKSAVIVHPSRTARSGKFDCEKVPLSTLLEYRTDDQKEHTFEVSLFVEQFRDMVLRDSAFNIYKALVVAPETNTTQEGAEKHKDEDDQSAKRRRVDEAADEKDKVVKEKRTIDSNLLFSFTVFDTGYAGYFKLADIEGILFSLGLNLSRSQTRKLVQKIAGNKESFHYRQLTDKDVGPNDEQELSHLNAILDDVDYLEELAMGNKVFLPEDHRDTPSIIFCPGDSSHILKKVEENEQSRQNLELKFSQQRDEMIRVREQLNSTRDSENAARQEAKRIRDELSNDREKLKDQRQLNRTYNRLLIMTNDHVTRATSDIKKQFDREENDKKALTANKEKESDSSQTQMEVETKISEKTESVTVVDSA